MIYFHSFRSPGLIIDIVHDIRDLNELARESQKAGMIILGGGSVNIKSRMQCWLCELASFKFTEDTHICCQRNGADHSSLVPKSPKKEGSSKTSNPWILVTTKSWSHYIFNFTLSSKYYLNNWELLEEAGKSWKPTLLGGVLDPRSGLIGSITWAPWVYVSH